ncbi:hypothetical protein GW750_08865 [bacterium]|nr:hypothetical protein [bacterium]
MIHKHKTTIHDFEQTVALVYQNKQDIITSSQKNFLSDLDMYKHDVGYLEKLLQVDIVKQEQRDTLSSLR